MMTQKERKFTVEVSSPSDCKRVLSIKIPREELDAEKELVLAELRKDLRVPGFRKGKVPRKYVETNYGDAIEGDAVRNLLPEVYELALAQQDISPVGEPRFENVSAEPGQDLSVDIEVEVRPDIDVKGYRDMTVRVEKRNIDDHSVDHALEHLRERMAQYVVVDRPVRQGDLVLIDYAPVLDDGSLDEKQLARNYPVDTGAESVLPAFREGLVNMEMNDQKDIVVKYPDDFPEEKLAGATKTFSVTVKEIKEKQMPEIDDEFARSAGEQFKDLEALRQQVREDLIKDEEKRYVHEAEEKIIDGLIEQNPFDVPDTMVNNYLSSVLDEDRRRRPQVPDEAEREREVREHFHAAAVRTVKKYLIMEAVRRQENIEVEAPEVDARIAELAGDGERAEQVRQYFRDPRHRRGIESEMIDQKVLQFLRENADIKVA